MVRVAIGGVAIGSISRPLVVTMVGIAVVSIRVGVISMVSITISRVTIRSISRPLVVAMVGISVSRVAIRSLSISRPLVVAMVGITISMVSIAIGRIAIAIRNSMMRASISFRLSC